MEGVDMEVKDVIAYLQKELPEFQYISGEDTPHEENWSSIRVVRDGKEIVLDVSKVDNKKAMENLKVYIKSLWDKDQS
jgi:hypothetical protein